MSPDDVVVDDAPIVDDDGPIADGDEPIADLRAVGLLLLGFLLAIELMYQLTQG